MSFRGRALGRVLVVAASALAAHLLAGCVTAPAAPPPATPGMPVAPQQRRPDGLIYNVSGGIGVGTGHALPTASFEPGFAAVAGLTVGLSGWDWIIVGLRVDAGTAGSNTLGDLGLHLAVFPGAKGVGAVRDLQIFGDAAVGGPLARPSGNASGAAIGVGRVGVAWERWRLNGVSIGPFLAGQMARGAGEGQSSALVGVSMSFTSLGMGGEKR